MGKLLPISLTPNFTPNTMGCYGLTKPNLLENDDCKSNLNKVR